MLAGHIAERGRIDLVEHPEPRLRAAHGGVDSSLPGTIIFQPEVTCLCGSDLPFFDGDEHAYPLRVGLSLHEMVGTVVETSGEKFKPGDRVLGVPLGQVGFFERYELTEERVIALDPRKPPEIALLAQPLGTAIFALRKLPSLINLNVVVVGQGPMGQLHNALLRNLGAKQIIGVDKLASRLAVSEAMGATATIDTTRQDPASEVARRTNDRMADLVIEAVGHANEQLNLCVDLCRDGGQILFFGVPEKTLGAIEWSKLFFKNINVQTSVDPDFSIDFPLAMQWICEDRIDVAPLITHHYELAEIQTAFETFRDKKDGALKVIVTFPASER